MTNPTHDSLSSDPQSSAKQTPWWNRPVTGENGLLGELLQKNEKTEVPESAISLRSLQLMDLRVFAKTAEAIDSQKFGNEDFLAFVKIKYLLNKGMGEYAGIEESLRLLQLAIQAKDSFIAIAQTEIRYRGYKQQELYSFVDELLKNQTDNRSFQEQVQAKANSILTQVKTDEGQKAITAYAKHMDRISQNNLGLKLLSLFKASNLADYSVLRTVADVIRNIEIKHLHDAKTLLNIVSQNYHAFEKLQNIIQLPKNCDPVQTFAVMIQFISLSHQHEISYLKFDELMRVLRKWYQNYQVILQIYQEYPASQYKLPKEFSEPIPGESLYLKYQKWLTDKKTGMVYMDLT
ncbi:MAG: hypothetical protein VKJ02_03930 [Snowella sp.]|nr:hypothetical protein [Snowella sp.]